MNSLTSAAVFFCVVHIASLNSVRSVRALSQKNCAYLEKYCFILTWLQNNLSYRFRITIMQFWRAERASSASSDALTRRELPIPDLVISAAALSHLTNNQGAICRGGFPPFWSMHPCLCWITFIPGGDKNIMQTRSDVQIWIKWFAIRDPIEAHRNSESFCDAMV